MPKRSSGPLQLGQWERQSHPLAVLPQARSAFTAFLPHLKREMVAVRDPTLQHEVDLLQKLIAVGA